MAEYFVAYESGDDTGAGNQLGPWQHCPGDPNAGANPLATALAAGDTVYFKGGETYRGEIFCNWDGAAGSYITYDGNSGGLWGAGKAIISGLVATVIVVGIVRKRK